MIAFILFGYLILVIKNQSSTTQVCLLIGENLGDVACKSGCGDDSCLLDEGLSAAVDILEPACEGLVERTKLHPQTSPSRPR